MSCNGIMLRGENYDMKRKLQYITLAKLYYINGTALN